MKFKILLKNYELTDSSIKLYNLFKDVDCIIIIDRWFEILPSDAVEGSLKILKNVYSYIGQRFSYGPTSMLPKNNIDLFQCKIEISTNFIITEYMKEQIEIFYISQIQDILKNDPNFEPEHNFLLYFSHKNTSKTIKYAYVPLQPVINLMQLDQTLDIKSIVKPKHNSEKWNMKLVEKYVVDSVPEDKKIYVFSELDETVSNENIYAMCLYVRHSNIKNIYKFLENIVPIMNSTH